MVQAINPNRIVPVQEDLTLPEDTFEIIRGWESMNRVDKELADSVEALPGEWLVLGANNKLARPGASSVPNTYLVIAGTDRFDVAATGQATVVMASSVIVRTKRFHSTLDTVGQPITIKNLGADVAVPSLGVVGTDNIFGYVIEVGTDYIVYETKQP